MKIEQQLDGLLARFQQALAADDWDQLSALDQKLQQAIPKLRQASESAGIKQKLAQLNQFYSQMIVRGEDKKAEIKQQIQQQQTNNEGMQAYLQNR